MDNYVHLHRHSTFSIYDGAGTPLQGALRAKALGQTALALTDHGNMMGIIEHYQACKAVGIKPILGVEAYFQPLFEPGQGIPYYHLTLLAKDLEGYHNLCRATTEANRDKFYRRQIMDWDTLSRYREGVICLSGCVASFFSQTVLHSGLDEARKVAEHFLNIYGDNFYFEVQPQGFDDQLRVNEAALRVAEEFGRPVAMTSDAHYTSQEEYDSYQMMWKMSPASSIADYSTLFMHSEADAVRFWRETNTGDPSPYILTTAHIADQCNVELNFPELVPKIEDGVRTDLLLLETARDALKERGKWNDEYRDRLKYELRTILGKHFEDYFLLCADLVNYAKSKGIAVGTGRGSVCGSLVAYALGITKVDPIVMGIEFDRFMTPQRATMPDVDMDFGQDRRDEVIAYAINRFAGKSGPIANLIRFKVDNTINDLSKVMGVEKADCEWIKLQLHAINYELHHFSYQDLLKHGFARKVENKYPDLLKHFCWFYGQVRAVGKHAAGVAITGDELTKYVPLHHRDGKLQTSYDMKSLSFLNVIKFDILGLATATLLQLCEQVTGIKMDDIPLDDPDVFAAFKDGDTSGIFQLERRQVKDMLRKVSPDNIGDIVALLAINRPAALQQGQLDAYVAGKRGTTTANPLFKQYCADSYGALIYQEQTMRLCVHVAKLDWATTTKIIKSIDKPVKAGDPLQKAFVDGAVAHSGLDPDEAAELYYKMTRYSFNKGHSAGYALISYYAMYYKVHYPLAFYYASLACCDDEVKEKQLQREALMRDVIILKPHVNGKPNYSITTIEGDDAIQIGLLQIKGVGKEAAKTIIANGPYSSLEEFEEKMSHYKVKVNAKVKTALKDAGALEFDIPTFKKECIRYCVLLRGRRAA